VRLPKVPDREPDDSFNRPSDSELVEVYATKHWWRSKDRVLDGTVYYRALIVIAGHVHDHSPRRWDSPETAVKFVRGIFKA
jgi:hypothetical protein